MDSFDGDLKQDQNDLSKLNKQDLKLMNTLNPEEAVSNPFSLTKQVLYDSTEASSTEKSKSPEQNDFKPTGADESPPEVPNADDFARYTPIAALSCNSSDWIIKARVTKKYDRRTWNNARGKGYLMNIELCDAFGSQIQCTFFKEAVDKFENVLQ